ncbi:MAG: NCS2 family permease [Actinobacteria bacterium]|nr:NCS2 family permease [Actinomycetota bacterium]
MSTMTQTPRSGSGLDSWFEITKRGSDTGREIRGGIVTFITMAYIVVLNPLIIGTVPDSTGKFLGGGAGPNIPLVAAATALLAGLLTIAMGLFGKMPIALAAGLGLNGFVAYQIATKSTWEQAMGLVVLEGLIILVLVLTGFRRAVFEAVPAGLRYAIGVGIGLFITLIGLVDAKIVQQGVPLATLGSGGTMNTWPMFVFCAGLIVTIILVAKQIRGGILIGIAVATVLAFIVEAAFKPMIAGADGAMKSAWSLNTPKFSGTPIASPDFSLLGQVDLFGALKAAPLAAGLAIFTLLLSDFFDTMGTVYGIAAEADLLDENGNVPNLDKVLIVDSVAAAAGGFGGTSSNTSYIESASGVGDGARTGLASVVTGGLFLLATFIAPLVGVIPHEAATPALVVVGFLMLTQIKKIDFSDYSIGIPAFLTMVMMPFTYSIANGIGAGFISWVAIKAATGRSKEIKPLMWVVALAFVVFFAMHLVTVWFG